MSRSSTPIGPIDLIGAAFSLPLVSLVVAVLVVGGIHVIAATRDRRAATPSADIARSVCARYLPERRALGGAAIAVIVLFAVENVVRGYVWKDPDLVAWWRYATPVLCAFLGIAVALSLIIFRGSTPPEAPVAPGVRRDWLSFGPRAGLVGATIVALALVSTTITSGLASSVDGRGRYVWLVIPVPNEAQIDPIRVPFYGWAYGAPVLICLALLTAVTSATLHSNAVRPYLRPETVAAERDARRELARGAVRIATAGMLLALAGAWRLVARAGSGGYLIVEGQNGGEPYDAAWRYAELAVAAGWCAPAVEVVAFVPLVLVAGRLLREPAPALPPALPEETTDLETVR